MTSKHSKNCLLLHTLESFYSSLHSYSLYFSFLKVPRTFPPQTGTSVLSFFLLTLIQTSGLRLITFYEVLYLIPQIRSDLGYMLSYQLLFLLYNRYHNCIMLYLLLRSDISSILARTVLVLVHYFSWNSDLYK